jgi:hypothetical protein
VDEQVEHLRLDGDEFALPAQLASAGIERIVAEQEAHPIESTNDSAAVRRRNAG